MGISPTTRGLGPRRVQANSKQAITYNKCRIKLKKERSGLCVWIYLYNH